MTPYLQTYQGKRIDIQNPKPDTIDIYDIAMALSRICRFNGHTSQFYSVAQHCTYCVKLASTIEPENTPLALACLLHDAAEAYLSDIPSPVKQYLPVYKELEDHLLAVIFDKYGLNSQLTEYAWAQIMHVDQRILFTEKRDVLTYNFNWGIPEVPPADFIILPYDHMQDSYDHFLATFWLLYSRRIPPNKDVDRASPSHP